MGINGYAKKDQPKDGISRSIIISRNPGNNKARAIPSYESKKISKETTRARGRKRARTRKETQHRRYQTARECQIF